jgi:hypothetical protein
MLLPRRILIVPAIGAALLIGACGGHHNTAVTNAQAAAVGTEVMSNVLQTFSTANGNLGIEPAAAKRAAVTSPLSCTTAGVCTYAATTFPCVFGTPVTTDGVLTAVLPGNASLAGTYDETTTTNTTTEVETEAVTNANFTLSFAAPPTPALGCSYDDILVLTSGSVGITGTGIDFDLTTGNVQLPFTLTASGNVHYTPGADAPSTYIAGECQANITATYEFVPPIPTTACTTEAPCPVQAAVSGSVCGKTIPASTVIEIGDLPTTPTT